MMSLISTVNWRYSYKIFSFIKIRRERSYQGRTLTQLEKEFSYLYARIRDHSAIIPVHNRGKGKLVVFNK
ncbi:hypothetical protein AQUCO_00100095v1 [Aquilegia coerulea]|uniref:Uncharacterized protein n=1 Tax=Aquilegia coerulea TaxID=218851 RepID=A0A2G5F8N5_AQUCA|nr:hypothetical protein AQUCO_00100095v1 [Aquilegia coerulea]